MHYSTGRYVPSRPTRLSRVKAKVDVIEICVIPFVQQSDITQNLLPNDDAGSGYPVRLAPLIWNGRRHHPALEQSAHQSEFEASLELAQGGVKPKCRALRRTIRIFQAAPCDAHLGMLIHEID